VSLVRGDGSRIFDADGREYLDFFNGHGASLFGHSNPTLVSALEDAAKGVWSSGAGFESPAREELARLLGGILGDGRVFVCNSGTEAIEAALKLATALRQGRKRILACRRSFHGRTCGALSLTFNPKYRAPFKSLLAEAEHVNPEDMPGKIDVDTAAVFVEPVQGEGGVYPLEAETGMAISEACRDSGAILVADEIQSGLGRCGAMLASGLVGLTPDIVCLAKGLAGGLPVGAAVWRASLGDFPQHSHGSTYGGADLVSKVAVAALKLIGEKKYAEHARRLGEELRAALGGINNSAIKDIRGLGLLNGVEIDLPSIDVVRGLQRKGLIALAAGPRVVRFLPSFAVSSEDVADAVKIFGEVLRETGGESK
jgi:acetylornithine/LysW-gamma-L-lysine aminotransferase